MNSENLQKKSLHFNKVMKKVQNNSHECWRPRVISERIFQGYTSKGLLDMKLSSRVWRHNNLVRSKS